jgi:hypothetical protein
VARGGLPDFNLQLGCGSNVVHPAVPSKERQAADRCVVDAFGVQLYTMANARDSSEADSARTDRHKPAKLTHSPFIRQDLGVRRTSVPVQLVSECRQGDPQLFGGPAAIAKVPLQCGVDEHLLEIRKASPVA